MKSYATKRITRELFPYFPRYGRNFDSNVALCKFILRDASYVKRVMSWQRDKYISNRAHLIYINAGRRSDADN